MDRPIPPRIQPVIDDCLPLLKPLALGRYAVSIGGSHGKGTHDGRSDVDFRIFCDDVLGAPKHWETDEWKAFDSAVHSWRARGIDIDYCWIRTIKDIEAQMDAWLGGNLSPEPLVWAIWGYHLLTDIQNQMVIDDPSGIISAWKKKLASYPQPLKKAILRKHLDSLRYWRNDYHYLSKVQRKDAVFLAGLTSKLVHDLVQIIFALNETYYIGDGNNLSYMERFAIKPADFSARVGACLYPVQGEDAFQIQHERLCRLIDDVFGIVEKHCPSS